MASRRRDGWIEGWRSCGAVRPRACMERPLRAMPLDSFAHRLVQRLTKQRRNAAARSRRIRVRESALVAAIEENGRLGRALADLRRRHETVANRGEGA